MASGDTLITFLPVSNEPPATNFPTFDIRNNIVVLDFDAATDESTEFGGFMPRNYAGTTGLTVTIGWMSSSATSGNVIWDVAFKSFTDDVDDVDTKAFAAVNSVTATTASLSGEIAYDTITFTDGVDMDSVVAGEYFRMSINRDANNASDTMTGDAELVFIEIQET